MPVSSLPERTISVTGHKKIRLSGWTGLVDDVGHRFRCLSRQDFGILSGSFQVPPGRRSPELPALSAASDDIGGCPVNQDVLMERFFQMLIDGNREGARCIVQETIDAGTSAERLMTHLFWPTITLLHKLDREDQISNLAHHFATRLLRSLADQAQTRLERSPRNGRRVLVVCGPQEQNELAACMAADLIEAGGFEIGYAGGGIASDEIIARVGEDRPDVLFLFSSAASDLPDIRSLIDHLNEFKVNPNMQTVVGGGVFNRAPGLAEEIGADLYIAELEDVVSDLVEHAEKRATPDQRTVGRKRRSAGKKSAAA